VHELEIAAASDGLVLCTDGEARTFETGESQLAKRYKIKNFG